MSLHAVQDVGDAFAATRDFLTPVSVRQWLKLALVVFFVGGGMSLPTAQFNTSGLSDGAPTVEPTEVIPADLVPLLVGIVVIAILLGVAFAVVGAIMEFVFIESLRSGDVRIRRFWSRRWRQGLRLFAFRVLIGLPFLALLLAWIALLVAPFVAGVGTPSLSVGTLLLGIPLFIVLGLVYGLIGGFTTAFVVPIMIREDCGVLAGWRRLWGSITRDWREYAVYAILAFVLTLVLGLLASTVVGFLAVIFLMPLAAVGVVTYLALSFTAPALAIYAVLAVLFVLLVVAGWAAVQVPVVVYLRYYALLVLGDVDESLDLVADQRRAVRD